MSSRSTCAWLAMAMLQVGCPRPEGSTDVPVASTTKTEGSSATTTIAKAQADPASSTTTSGKPEAETPAPKEPDPLATYPWLSDAKVATYPARVDS
ncbi:MAG: hypothetical protein ABI175_09120, partial [Polyangiales bacterium]